MAKYTALKDYTPYQRELLYRNVVGLNITTREKLMRLSLKLISLASACFLTSCVATDPPQTVTRMFPVLFGLHVPMPSEKFDGGLAAGSITKNSNSGATTLNEAEAIFYDNQGIRVPVASVSINGNVLTSTGSNRYRGELSGERSSDHVWQVNGLAAHPTFSDTLDTPTPLRIVSPTFLGSDSLSISEGFSIGLETIGSDSVTVMLTYEPQISKALDSTIKDSLYYTMSFKVPAQVLISVSPSHFQSWPRRGVVKLQVYSARFKDAVHGGKHYRLLGVSGAESLGFLKP